jgi:alkanesulfonate monooxygenase SsuD/methylene tetrahydromethanopterin reductase-like flavin-dependent oxidoreductase (luciferase family)
MGSHLPLRGTAVALAGSTIHRVFGRDVRDPLPIEVLAEAVALTERTGYRALFVPDHGVWDPFSLLSAFAERTSRLRLATGVVTITSRSPEALGAAVVTLDRVSGGRAILGVGSGPERRIERVAAYLEELLDHVQADTPLYLAAIGPRMVELAGGRAEGVLLNWCTPARVRRAREELARVRWVFNERPRGDIQIAVYVRACLGHDEEHALAALRQAVGMYTAIPTYRRQLEAEGLGEAAAAAAEAHRRGDPAAVPQDLVDALCVRGGRDEAVARIDEYRAAGADLVVVYPVPAQEPASSLMGTIMAAAPNPAVEA